ncbi:hypothetical protein CPB83DRAFT_847271 [Crepidotus variabilis]|uniref:Uncharacterized protein n=1 Tax=Crepidotus variabilis TaxID=179855 RepID=A0A9P6JU88_9AGAR|nr:hypothetical protein CPB83DRAFT_847271 [Crepidotus variabilis]
MSTRLAPNPPGLLRIPDAQRASGSTISLSSTSTSSSGTGSSTFDHFSKGGSSTSSLSDYTPLPSPLDTGAKSIFGCEPVQVENSSSRFSDEQWNGAVTDEHLKVHLAAVQPGQGVSQLSDMDRWLHHDEYEYEEDDSLDLEPHISAVEALALRLKRDPPTHAAQRALAFMEKRKMPESTTAQTKVIQEEVIEDYAEDFDLDFSILSIPETPNFLSALPSTPRILPVDHYTSHAGDSSMLDAISPLLLDDPKMASLPPFHPQSLQGRPYPTSPLTVASVLFNQHRGNTTPVSSDRTPTQSPRQLPTSVGLGLEIVDTNIQVDNTGRPVVSPATSALFAGSDFPVEGLSDYYVTGTIDVEPFGVPSSSNDSMTRSNNLNSDLANMSSTSDLEPIGVQLEVEDNLLATADVALDALVATQVDEVNTFDVESFETPLSADDSFASFATSASCYSVPSPEFNLDLIPDHPREYALDADSVFDGPSSDWINFGYMNESSEPLLDTIMRATEDHTCSGPSRQRTQAGEFTARLTERFMATLPSLPSLNSIASSSAYFADVEDVPDASCDDSHDSESGALGFLLPCGGLLTAKLALSTCLAPELDVTDDTLEHMDVSLPYDNDSSSLLFTIQEEDESTQDEEGALNTSSTIRRYVPRAPPSHLFNYSRKEGDEHPSYDTFCPTVTAGSNHIAAINADILAARESSSTIPNNSAASLPTITLSLEPDRPLNNGKNHEGLGLGLPSSLVKHSETRRISSAQTVLPTSEASWNLSALASGSSVKRVVSSHRVSISSSRVALSPLSNRSLSAVKSPVPTTPSLFQPFTLQMSSMIDSALLTTAASSQPRQRSPLPSSKHALTSTPLPQPTLMSKSDSRSGSRSSWNAFTNAMSRLSWSSSSSSGRVSPGMIEHADVPQTLGIFNRTGLSSKLPTRTTSSTPSWSRKIRMLF